jgi:hypothetical protein
MQRLASLKVLTNQLYHIEREASAAPPAAETSEFSAVEWLDDLISLPEDTAHPAGPTPAARWKATRSESHHTVVRQLLVENIPPNVCSLEQLQNELDCESKKYVVKTAEMKHRRGNC